VGPVTPPTPPTPPTSPTSPTSLPLARLLGMAYRQLVDDLHAALRARGWTDVREVYGFVLLAVREADTTTTALAELLGVSKQATSKLLDAMEEGGYVRRRPDEHDGRVKVVGIEPRGRELLDAVEAVYVELEEGWAEVIGVTGLEQTRRRLERVLRSRHGAVLPPLRPT
jgi:DNA-binding MarR family transcriptional regulator